MNERLTKAKQDEKDRRAERLAKALRENLKRRKAQARSRDRAEPGAVLGKNLQRNEDSGGG